MKTKTTTSSLIKNLCGTAVIALAGASVFAGPGNTVRPITNPTLFDNPLPQTNIRAIVLQQSLPAYIETAIGDVPVGGDFNLLAVQIEYAFSDTLSLVATKDGYIDFNPNSTLSKAEGFANIAAGLKYRFLSDFDDTLVMSGTVTAELPSGNRDVWQGEGDGYINAILNASKAFKDIGLTSAVGLRQPMSSEDATIAFLSARISLLD